MFSRINVPKYALWHKNLKYRYFSVQRLPSGKSLTFPFSFSGYDKPMDKANSQLYDSALEQIYEEDVKEGFKFAYKTTLEALTQKDIDFFKDICEPKLYREIEKG